MAGWPSGQGGQAGKEGGGPLHLSPFSPPDGDRRVDPPVLSGRVPGGPVVEHYVLDTSVDEVYFALQ